MILPQSGPIAPADKPHQLIRDAVHDWNLQEKIPELVEIRMGTWHEPQQRPDGICYQCLAGAVMSRRLGVALDEPSFPGWHREYARLRALNDFRIGIVDNAMHLLGFKSDWVDLCFHPSANPEELKKQLLDLADKIEERLQETNAQQPS